MLWEELLIDREPGDEELAAALAELFGLARGGVVVRESDARAEDPGGARVVCERLAGGGDFPVRFSVYVLDEGLEGTQSLPLVERLCRRLGCSCLISDDSPNPYSMLHVRADGTTRRVYLDTARLDEHDEFVIDRPADEGGRT